jgi:hypothetical protein
MSNDHTANSERSHKYPTELVERMAEAILAMDDIERFGCQCDTNESCDCTDRINHADNLVYAAAEELRRIIKEHTT